MIKKWKRRCNYTTIHVKMLEPRKTFEYSLFNQFLLPNYMLYDMWKIFSCFKYVLIKLKYSQTRIRNSLLYRKKKYSQKQNRWKEGEWLSMRRGMGKLANLHISKLLVFKVALLNPHKIISIITVLISSSNWNNKNTQ